MMPLKILVVDDETVSCENLKDILEDIGHEVQTATDPDKALELVEKSKLCNFDVALLDFKMPKMNGAKLLENIRESCPDVIAVLITAFSDSFDSNGKMTDRFNQVIAKPLEVERLLNLLNRLTPLVLCVDDDKQFCDSILEIFEQKGFLAAFSHDVESAKQQLIENSFDVVLIDLKLPDGNGSEAISEVSRRFPKTKTILITGYPDQLVTDADSDFQPDATFLKPIDPAKLLNVIFRLANQT